MVDLINLNQQRLRDIYQGIKLVISINIIGLQKGFSNAEHSNALLVHYCSLTTAWDG